MTILLALYSLIFIKNVMVFSINGAVMILTYNFVLNIFTHESVICYAIYLIVILIDAHAIF